jgi:phosphate transporter
MKFSSSLKFNAVAEWWDDYIAYVQSSSWPLSASLTLFVASYSALKKYIFQLEKQFLDNDSALHDLEASHERSRLIASGTASTVKIADKIFTGLLDKELDKIVTFYKDQEAELEREIHALEADIELKDAQGPSPARSEYDDDDEDDDDDDEEPGKRSECRRKRSTPNVHVLTYFG